MMAGVVGASAWAATPDPMPAIVPTAAVSSTTPAVDTTIATAAFTPSPPSSTATAAILATQTPAPVTLNLWQSIEPGATDSGVLADLVQQYMRQHPIVTVNVQAIPSYQAYQRWQSGVAAGTAADLVLASNDTL